MACVSVKDDEEKRVDKGVHKGDVQSYLEQKLENVVSVPHPPALHPLSEEITPAHTQSHTFLVMYQE